MNDQAQGLRNLIKSQNDSSDNKTKVLTITSGKGGVGKSNFTLNFALALQLKGYKVLIFDADIGMANIDVLMGVTPKYNLYHLLKREKNIKEIITKGVHDLQIISGGSGIQELLHLSQTDLEYFAYEASKLLGSVDFILFDTGAGLTQQSLNLMMSSHETIVVTTPEPTSITDAYAIIKMVHSMNQQIQFKMVVNRVTTQKEGTLTSDKIKMVAKQFLNLDISTLGYISEDVHISKAVKKQEPFLMAYPNCSASRDIHSLSRFFLSEKDDQNRLNTNVKNIFYKMIRMLK
ncbi:MinD/ParA family protein [Chengkuizengella axinellae]|uniref:MinD/ParA family protein n=1 Tax=Chengkuizengella axinellae TaxID=3064388 RepID=A0ABT9IVS0_9BACL|nr:MinD/ParA family protein [Chengkuizengella sp. 2205SS18-9]MDP5273459.1 MinD/ParA family protein [Chengkuizengella sp. 2205SS18-9]